MKNEFCPKLNAAIDKKTTTDAALLGLWREICAGTKTYSMSAVLSAMEDCDDAMDDIWQAFKPAISPSSAPQEWIDILKSLNVGGYDVRKAVEPASHTVTDIRAQQKAAG